MIMPVIAIVLLFWFFCSIKGKGLAFGFGNQLSIVVIYKGIDGVLFLHFHPKVDFLAFIFLFYVYFSIPYTDWVYKNQNDCK